MLQTNTLSDTRGHEDSSSEVIMLQQATSASHQQANSDSSPTEAIGLSFNDIEPVEVRIRDVSVSINTAPSWLEPETYAELLRPRGDPDSYHKKLLHSVSANLQPGSLTAIIGGSGSGKTTLLDTIAERVTSSRLSYGGITTFNGRVGVQSVRHAYVVQQDILLPTLTVRETLRYAAELRLPPSTPADERRELVEEIIRELCLQDCADTRIGSSRARGCSGGEKRRVSIGVQLLANPSVLFLDEPTTGLDAASALQLMRTMKSLAEKGRVVITTIHQPRSEIWELSDNLIVLSKGGPVFSGPVANALPWFEAQGFKSPAFINPADFIIDTSAVDSRSPEREAESSTRVNALKDAWLLESAKHFPPLSDIAAGHAKETSSIKTHTGHLRQIQVLTHRTMTVTCRDPLGMTASILEAIIMGLATGYMFYNLGRDQAGIRSRQGCLYVAASLQGYIMLIFETYRMTLDIPTFDREYSEGCVSPLAFICSRRLAKLLIEDIPVPLLYSILVYFLAGFEREVSKFFIFLAISLINQYIVMTCATACVTISRHFAVASLIANLVVTIQSIASGMIIQVDTMPVYVRWIRWITYTFYTFGAYTANEFQDNFYDCPYPGGASNPSCTSYTGEYVMKSLGFPRNWVGRPIAFGAAFIVAFLIVSLVCLQFFKVEIAVSRSRRQEVDTFSIKEKVNARSIDKTKTVAVGLERFGLTLENPSLLKGETLQKTVLQPTDAKFEPGVLNVIIGPSGSGKTSLLNAMALRLHNSMGTKYYPSGNLTFNGIVPSDVVIQSVCSYVHQDDDALLPTLTVRETLRYAAALRLPQFMSIDEKYQRAEEILLKMGLKDCANNMIGNEMVKGISGGEKRRVSIAVQILTEPRVLLIDEPTSGLDAFTAHSIIEVLQGLASEGKTIIMAIHQARSDLFDHFGNVLLLARGGSAVYFGPGRDMVGYFAKHGYQCPLHTNPADFAMDMITVQAKQDDEEVKGRQRVQKLLKLWDERSVEGIDGDEPRSPTLRESTEENEKELEAGQKLAGPGSDSGVVAAAQPQTDSLFQRSNKTNLETPAQLGALMRTRAPLLSSLPLLFRRSLINTRRQPPLIIARIMQSCGVALIFTLFFAPLGHDYYSVQSRMGFVQQLGGFYVIGMLTNVAVYPNERDVFYREDEDGVYGVDAFLSAYTLAELPFEVLNSFFFALLAVFAVGLPQSAATYFISAFACFSGLSCGESLGIVFNTLFSHTGFAVNMMGVFLGLANAMAGVLSINEPALFRYFNYISPIRYETRAVAYYSLHGLNLSCTSAQLLQDGSCPLKTGDEALELYKFNEDPLISLVGMAVCTVVYRLVAWMLLKAVRGRWSFAALRRKS